MLEADPGYVPILRLLTSSEREGGHYAESIKYCEKLLDINREYSFAMASEARTFLKMKKDKEALKLAQNAFDTDRKDGYAVATLALAHHFNGNTARRDEIINAGKKIHWLPFIWIIYLM